MKLTKAHINKLSKLTDNVSTAVLGSLGGPSTTTIRSLLKEESGKELTDAAADKLNVLLDNSDTILKAAADNPDASSDDLIAAIFKALSAPTAPAEPKPKAKKKPAEKKKAKVKVGEGKVSKKKGHNKVLEKNRNLAELRKKSISAIDKIAEDARKAGVAAMGESALLIIKEAKQKAKRTAFKLIDKKYAWLSAEERSKAKEIVIKNLK